MKPKGSPSPAPEVTLAVQGAAHRLLVQDGAEHAHLAAASRKCQNTKESASFEHRSLKTSDVAFPKFKPFPEVLM